MPGRDQERRSDRDEVRPDPASDVEALERIERATAKRSAARPRRAQDGGSMGQPERGGGPVGVGAAEGDAGVDPARGGVEAPLWIQAADEARRAIDLLAYGEARREDAARHMNEAARLANLIYPKVGERHSR